jgi:DNA-binding MarR family transcriptional regulator
VLADELLRSLAAVRRTSRRHAGRPAEWLALTGAQLELARLVRRLPGVSVTDAARELRVAPNTVSTLVRQLVDAGVVVRQADPGDRRVARLDLADDIRKAIDAWRDRRVVALGAALDALPPDDRKRLSELLPLLTRVAVELELVGEAE